jgi:late competence protein required for DNA uptake (superfamily II DNA/RNA helicase)
MSEIKVLKEVCDACGKNVYPQEKVTADNRIWHKSCFRCLRCNNVLKLGSFAAMEGKFYCKVCFKKLFFSKGNYSEGFGKLTPQQEHDVKTGKVDNIAPPTLPDHLKLAPPAGAKPEEPKKEEPKKRRT